MHVFANIFIIMIKCLAHKNSVFPLFERVDPKCCLSSVSAQHPNSMRIYCWHIWPQCRSNAVIQIDSGCMEFAIFSAFDGTIWRRKLRACIQAIAGLHAAHYNSKPEIAFDHFIFLQLFMRSMRK